MVPVAFAFANNTMLWLIVGALQLFWAWVAYTRNKERQKQQRYIKTLRCTITRLQTENGTLSATNTAVSTQYNRALVRIKTLEEEMQDVILAGDEIRKRDQENRKQVAASAMLILEFLQRGMAFSSPLNKGYCEWKTEAEEHIKVIIRFIQNTFYYTEEVPESPVRSCHVVEQ